jgi:hypothetical protein
MIWITPTAELRPVRTNEYVQVLFVAQTRGEVNIL